MEQPTIVEVKPQLVLGITRHAPYKQIPQLMMESFGYLQSQGAAPAGAPVYVYHEFGRENEKLTEGDLEVAWPIAQKIAESEEIKCYELPGGQMAKVTHKGPYEQMVPVYGEFIAWISQQGKTPHGPTREVYLNNPQEVGLENALTEIYIPIE